MNRRQALHILKPLWLVVLALMPVGVAYLPSATKPWLSAILVPTYILWLIKLAYDNSDVVFFHLTRFWLYATNGLVRWNMSVEYQVSLAPSESLSSTFDTLRRAWPTASIWQDEAFEKQIQLPDGGGILRVRQIIVPTLSDDENRLVVVDLSDLLVPFRASVHTLEQIISVLESIRHDLQPKTEKYTLKVRFDHRNPYYGLFVRQLRIPNQEVVSFQCDIDQHVGPNKGRIAVNKDRLALTSNSLTVMSSLTQRYITLASLDLTSS